MLNWRNVGLIFLREVRDQLRDRRTLFMVAVLPILLYPAMGIGMMQMTMLFSEQPRTIVILGADDLPEEPELLQDGSLRPEWFAVGTDAAKIRVVTDADVPPDEDKTDGAPQQAAADEKRLRVAAEMRDDLLRQAELERRLEANDDAVGDPDAEASLTEEELDAIDAELLALRTKLGQRLIDADIQVLLIVPEGFDESVRQAIATKGQNDYQRILPVRSRADEASAITYMRVSGVLDRYEREIRRQIQERAGLSKAAEKPVLQSPIDLALEEEVAANVWGKLFPAILIIMAATGAFYPAIDLAAGEKERGTMETLLICPAKRSEIVFGKFFTVLAFSLATAVLNLCSMAMTGKYVSQMGSALQQAGDLSLPPFSALIWIPVLLLPLAVMFSALCLALATFAKSSKEGQYYLTPLLLVVLGITVVTLAPGVEITPFSSILPIAGPGLLLKKLLTTSGGGAAVYAVPVLLSSIGYSLIAIWWAIDQFSREDILFREAERFELGAWLGHLFREKTPLPNPAEALVCFTLIMFLQFAAAPLVQKVIAFTDPSSQSTQIMKVLIAQQIVAIACPAMFMGLLLTSRPLRTLKLSLPKARFWGIAFLLPIVIHPVSVTLQALLSNFFPPLPPEVRQSFGALSDMDLPLWLALLAFGVAPAFCEELAFRGFILSGLSESRRTIWAAILLSAFAFGIIHMIPQQVFNATLIGIVLAMLCLKSGSLWPCVLLHLMNNGIAVLHMRYGENIGNSDPTGWFIRETDVGIVYGWPLVFGCVIALFFLIRTILPEPRANHPPYVRTPEPTQANPDGLVTG